MATLQEFKTLQASVSSSEQAEIAELYLTDRDSAVSKMIAITPLLSLSTCKRFLRSDK